LSLATDEALRRPHECSSTATLATPKTATDPEGPAASVSQC
jgi:hypothetical protein